MINICLHICLIFYLNKFINPFILFISIYIYIYSFLQGTASEQRLKMVSMRLECWRWVDNKFWNSFQYYLKCHCTFEDVKWYICACYLKTLHLINITIISSDRSSFRYCTIALETILVIHLLSVAIYSYWKSMVHFLCFLQGK